MNLTQLLDAVSGEFLKVSDDSLSNREVGHISIDSRSIKKGDTFFAIRGEKFDGHAFLKDVISKGALCCVISDESCLENLSEPSCVFIKVEDTTKALGMLAKFIVSGFNFPVVAVTGSCGKTTTKEILAAILKTKGEVLYSQKSFNNHVGVPLTAINIINNPKDYVAAIFEIGTNHPGEINYLTDIVRPDIAILTKVAPVHIGNFGSIDDLVFEKQQVFKYLKEDGVAIVNLDDFYKFKHNSANTNYFSLDSNSDADIYAGEIVLDKKQLSNFNLYFKDQKINITSPLLGKHNIYNILCASLAALNLGYTLEQVKYGVEQNLGSISGRLQLKSGKNDSVIIDDAYNANPTAVKASLEILANYSNNSKKCFVFADMGELGSESEFYHKEIGKFVADMDIDYFYVYGDLVKHSLPSYNNSGVHCTTKEELTLKLEELIKKEKGLTLLFKGSNSMGLKEVVNNLVSN